MHMHEYASGIKYSCQWFPLNNSLWPLSAKKKTKQWASKREEEDCYLVNTDVNSAGFEIFLKNELGTVLLGRNTFVGPQQYTQENPKLDTEIFQNKN